jgi:hypothetical protein
MREEFLRPLRAAAFFLTHAFLASVLILTIYGVRRLCLFLWGGDEPVMLGVIPLEYPFDAIDLGVIAIFGIRGLLAAYRALRE